MSFTHAFPSKSKQTTEQITILHNFTSFYAMSCYLSLLKIAPTTRQLHRSFRSLSLIHQNSSNVISRKGSANLILRRFKSNSSTSTKAADETKVQKVKLKVSDLRRLLSLAKSEKWKISGENENHKRHINLLTIPTDSCHWMSRHFVVNHHGSSIRSGQNTRHNLFERISRRLWGRERETRSVRLLLFDVCSVT